MIPDRRWLLHILAGLSAAGGGMYGLFYGDKVTGILWLFAGASIGLLAVVSHSQDDLG